MNRIFTSQELHKSISDVSGLMTIELVKARFGNADDWKYVDEVQNSSGTFPVVAEKEITQKVLEQRIG